MSQSESATLTGTVKALQQSGLAEPFPQAVQKRNPKGMTYIPVSEVITRLNTVLGAWGWDYEVVDVREAGLIETQTGTYPKWVAARVRMTVRFADGSTSVREGYGGHEAQFTGGDNKKGPVDLGDLYKSAVSDALKKAAQGFGVALDLARTEEAMLAEAIAKEEASKPKASTEVLNAIKEYVSTNPDKREAFNAWWKEHVGKKMSSGLVTEVEAAEAMAFLGIEPF